MKRGTRAKRLAAIGVLTAMALAVQYAENLLPPIAPGIPVKLGAANVFTLTAMMCFSIWDGLAVSAVRCTVGTLLLGGSPMALAYSAAGCAMSWAVTALLMKPMKRGMVTPIGVSVAGAFCFNVGQMAIGMVLVGKQVLAYFPLMGLLSIPTGACVGLAAWIIKRRLFDGRKNASL